MAGFALLAGVLAGPAAAVDPGASGVTGFQPARPQQDAPACAADEQVRPVEARFKLLDYALMGTGQLGTDVSSRYALVTVENLLPAPQRLNHNHFVGIQSDCVHLYPLDFERVLEAGEVLSLRLDFGRGRLPVRWLRMAE